MFLSSGESQYLGTVKSMLGIHSYGTVESRPDKDRVADGRWHSACKSCSVLPDWPL